MAENENGEEKTEQPTAKKLRDARKKGQVAKSNDVMAVASVLGVFAVMRVFAKNSYMVLRNELTYWIGICGRGFSETNIADGDLVYKTMLVRMVKAVAAASGPVMIAAILLTVIATGVQTKFLFSTEQMKPKLSKLNPLQGIKKMFSKKALFELAKSLLKFAVIVTVIYNEVTKRLTEYARTLLLDVNISFTYMAQTIFSVVMTLGLTFIVIAAIDMFYQKRTFNDDMKMTKQEVKEEFKQTEGDPHIKGKRRQKQMELHQLMMQNVKDADVVVRNPTHYAVAIKYDPEKASAPVITAKGADRAALRIIKEAEENNVALVENRPLARALYEKTEVDMEIPYEFYREVAQVLAFVYDLQKKKGV